MVELRARLESARETTEALLKPVSDDDLAAEISPLVPPLVWVLAHVAHFEELWLLRTIAEQPPIPDAHDAVYKAFLGERSNGTRRPPLKAPGVRAYAEDVRARVLDVLERIDFDAAHALVRKGFVVGLVVQNELQAHETILQALQLRTDREYPTSDGYVPERAPGGPAEIRVPGGPFTMGAVHEPWAYDNELAAFELELRPFAIDRAPVTNGQFAKFVESRRGYRSDRHWSPAGLGWREREKATAPLYWEPAHGSWMRTRFGRREPLPLDEPVQHVSYYEAEAYAHWKGRRLPTEAEWERAAGWHDHEGKFRYPWGQAWMGFEASLERRRFSPAPVGSYAGGVSPVGCVQMGGDVWEWTSSSFQPYPDFLSFPYPECSEVVLRRRGPRASGRILGDRPACRPHVVSQLGAARAGGTCSRASAASGTRNAQPEHARPLRQRMRVPASVSTSPRIPTISSNSACPATSGGEIWSTGSPRSSARQIIPASKSAFDR